MRNLVYQLGYANPSLENTIARYISDLKKQNKRYCILKAYVEKFEKHGGHYNITQKKDLLLNVYKVREWVSYAEYEYQPVSLEMQLRIPSLGFILSFSVLEAFGWGQITQQRQIALDKLKGQETTVILSIGQDIGMDYYQFNYSKIPNSINTQKLKIDKEVFKQATPYIILFTLENLCLEINRINLYKNQVKSKRSSNETVKSMSI